MKKHVLYGASTTGKSVLDYYGEESIAYFIDNNKNIREFCNKDVITFEEFLETDNDFHVVICSHKINEIFQQLRENGIAKVSVCHELYHDKDAPMSQNISSNKWSNYLKELCDIDNNEILEVGSRVVTGANFRNLFQKAKIQDLIIIHAPMLM